MELFANGDGEESVGNVCLLLNLESPATKNFTVKCKFGIVNKSGKFSKVEQMEGSRDEFEESCYGFSPFISHKELFAKSAELIPNDKLTIMCEVNSIVIIVNVKLQTCFYFS